MSTNIYGSTDPGDNIIDFRDVTARVEALRDERDTFDQHQPADGPDWPTECSDDAEELARLEKLLEETAGYGGDHQWQGTWYPGSMIADDYFKTYAEDFADDIGAINRDAAWPVCHIDWDAAAESLKQDYSSITYGGVEYWYR